ncbi:MAG: hypothetical protein ACTHKG_04410 [Nocardioides sp.]
MLENDEYDEVDAVVRIPKGERLADSRKTEGWSRGFTPKSTDKGPGHVEIRLSDGADEQPDEPEVVYVTEYIGAPQQELTASQQATADFLNRVMEELYEALKPVVAHWFRTRAVPAITAKREGFRLKRRHRKAPKSVRADAPEPIEEVMSQQVATTTPGEPAVTVTSEQFQALFMTWLGREDAQRALWGAIASAQIEDGEAATLAWQRSLAELSPEERSERVADLLSTNPASIEGLARLLTGGALVPVAE